MRPLVLSLGLLLAAPAVAADLDGEISVGLGLFSNHDPAFDLFSRHDAMASPGVRVGYALNDHVSFVLGWHHVRRGNRVLVPDGDFQAVFTGDAVTLGPKVGTPLTDWLFPYVTAQAVAFRGVIQLDDDPMRPGNPGQLVESALTPGVIGLGGLELRVPVGHDLAGAVHVEAGYEWLARGSYGDFGTLRPGGFTLRSGVGLRF